MDVVLNGVDYAVELDDDRPTVVVLDALPVRARASGGVSFSFP
jgi:hypothetical protein